MPTTTPLHSRMKGLFVLLLLCSSALIISGQVTYPAREETPDSGVCLSNEEGQVVRSEITQDIHTVLNDEVVPPMYLCDGTLGWQYVVRLNMSDSSQQCPDSWQLISSPRRTCGRTTDGSSTCDSVTFSTPIQYDQVCGRAIGYQFGDPESFRAYHSNPTTLEGQYVDGLSVTHGPPGSRVHIWTFAVGVRETDSPYTYECPCNGGPDAPPFINDDYFCESGSQASSTGLFFYPDDPLWDGQGCPVGNDCCSFNTPPWFTQQLDTPTTDDIEVRLCTYQGSTSEDIPIELLELYVK